MTTGVTIDDRPEPQRVRRTSDLLRLVAAVLAMAIVILPAVFGLGTADALQQDITNAVTTTPELIVSILNRVSSLIVLGLPLFLVGDLIWRRRWRGLAVSLATGVGVWVLSTVIADHAEAWLSRPLYNYLTNTPGLGPPAPAVIGLFAAVIAVAAVDGMASHGRTSLILWFTLGGLTALRLIDNSATLPSLLLSLLGGYAIGVAVRYLAGSENPRVPSAVLLDALVSAGLSVETFTQLVDSEYGRTYRVVGADRRIAMAQVFDPDLRASAVLTQLLRSLRVRTWVARPARLSLQGMVEAFSSPILMANQVGVSTPRLLASVEVNRRTAVCVVEELPDITPLTDLQPSSISDHTLGSLWDQLGQLHRACVSHEHLHPGCLATNNDGDGWLLDLSFGELATAQLRMRLDRAEMLATTALLVGIDRAVDVATARLGKDEVTHLNAFLQPVAMNPKLRSACREAPDLTEDLQEAIKGTGAEGKEIDQRFERIRLRTVASGIALTVAVFVLAGQLANVDFRKVVSDVEWIWALAALGGSGLSYFGAALLIRPFAPVKISPVRLLLAQFAASFVVLVAPPAVGSAGTNARLFQRAGAKPALAVASVGLASLVAVLTSVTVLLLMGLFAQTGTAIDIHLPSSRALIIVVAVLLLLGIALAVPASRKRIASRVEPIWRNTVPRLLDVARDPRRLISGALGNLLTTAGYSIALFFAVKAYGGTIALPTAVLVTLGVGVVGSVAPTPGGLGAVEAALVAGLTATGVPTSLALSAALLYRTVTFWFPTVPGWLSFHYLQRVGAL